MWRQEILILHKTKNETGRYELLDPESLLERSGADRSSREMNWAGD